MFPGEQSQPKFAFEASSQPKDVLFKSKVNTPKSGLKARAALVGAQETTHNFSFLCWKIYKLTVSTRPALQSQSCLGASPS